MNAAIHTQYKTHRRLLVVGAEPTGPRGGVSGEWVDGEIVATGTACDDLVHIDGELAIALRAALGRAVEGRDRSIRAVCRAGNELAVAVLTAKIAAERPAREQAAAEQARAAAADHAQQVADRAASQRRAASAVVAEFSAAPGALYWRGVTYVASTEASGCVRIERAFLDALRAAGVTGQALGNTYSAAQALVAKAKAAA